MVSYNIQASLKYKIKLENLSEEMRILYVLYQSRSL